MEITRRLSELICQTQFAHLPGEVSEYSKSPMLSALGAMVAGAKLPAAGSMAHYFEMGVAGRNGLGAALLASGGFTASPHILEASLGFFELVIPAMAKRPILAFPTAWPRRCWKRKFRPPASQAKGWEKRRFGRCEEK